MSLLDAVIATGQVPPNTATQAQKKRYSEILSAHLAVEVSEGLRGVGFLTTKPVFSTISGRAEHTDPAEKSEHFALLLFQPATKGKPASILKLIDGTTRQQITEDQYFSHLRDFYNEHTPPCNHTRRKQ